MHVIIHKTKKIICMLQSIISNVFLTTFCMYNKTQNKQIWLLRIPKNDKKKQ